MKTPSKESSDFRYNTGDSKVPWDAVAVKPDIGLTMDLLRFLVTAGEDAESYRCGMEEVERALEKVFRVGRPATKLSLGRNVAGVEDLAREMLGVKHASFVVNWTAGYDIALDMVGVKADDEVIIPAITFMATASPVLRKGARVVFSDVQRETANMDPEDVLRKITPRTKAIVPVHLGGYPVDMDPILEVAKKKGIAVIEDAAHGFGGHYKGKPLGAVGDFGAFSFHEVKNITSLGEGGIVVTNDPLGEQFAKARFVGFDLRTPPPEHWLYNITANDSRNGIFAAGNFSTTEIQAVALHRQMRQNAEILSARRAVAARLHDTFSQVEGLIPGPMDSADFGATFHLFLLRVDRKIRGGIQAMKAELANHGVTQIPHFCPLYHYRIFEQFGYDREAIRKACPNAEAAFFEEYTHLPIYGLSPQQVDYLEKAVVEAAKKLAITKP
ncbi:MAG: DegT/DnrJ/EryC1/StrS family aminotransferase [Chthoniobacterales bacterium]|nr:DegT/DnrJ/EryC1/StrS family aminotransferase [Chthoniobacterales bacterium]